MKYLALFLALTLSLSGFGQITYNITGSGACDQTLVVNQNGTLNGKNLYDDAGDWVISWSTASTRWEIRESGNLRFYNMTETTADPPCHDLGSWVVDGSCTTSTISGSSGGCGDTALPVELILFEVSNQPSGVYLEWTTASELNNEGFEVHYSANGNNWSQVGWVEGNGTKDSETQYQFEHRPINGLRAYYQLKQVDYDGKYEWLPIRSTTLLEDYAASYPNPASRELNINYEGTVNIVDITGKVALRTESKFVGHRLDISMLETGRYVLTILSKSGQTLTQNLIIK